MRTGRISTFQTATLRVLIVRVGGQGDDGPVRVPTPSAHRVGQVGRGVHVAAQARPGARRARPRRWRRARRPNRRRSTARGPGPGPAPPAARCRCRRRRARTRGGSCRQPRPARSAAVSSAGRSAGRSAARAATPGRLRRRAARPDQGRRVREGLVEAGVGHVRHHLGAQLGGRGPAARSAVTTTTRPTTGLASAAATVSSAIASTSSSCSAGSTSAPRRRVLAASRRFTGTITVQLTVPSLPRRDAPCRPVRAHCRGRSQGPLAGRESAPAVLRYPRPVTGGHDGAWSGTGRSGGSAQARVLAAVRGHPGQAAR